MLEDQTQWRALADIKLFQTRPRWKSSAPRSALTLPAVTLPAMTSAAVTPADVTPAAVTPAAVVMMMKIASINSNGPMRFVLAIRTKSVG